MNERDAQLSKRSKQTDESGDINPLRSYAMLEMATKFVTEHRKLFQKVYHTLKDYKH